MLIILEGVDGAGKTTLATKLRLQIEETYPGESIEVLHSQAPTAHPLTEYETPLHDYRPGTGRHVICDRWHLSELVYPEVFGRITEINPAITWHTEMFLKSRGALLVYVDPPSWQLREQFLARGDTMIKVEQLPELTARYAQVVEKSILARCVATNWSEMIVKQARMIDHNYQDLNQFVTYVGARRPKLLLLGDTSNDNDQSVSSPALQPYPATSGHYLLMALFNGGYDPQLPLGLANACSVDDVNQLWDTLECPTTVTLGNHAALEFPSAIRHVEHPQWVRRFHYRDALRYARQIVAGEDPGWKFD